MCELFAVSSMNKIKLNTLLKEFFKHSVEHPSGWGMVALDNAIKTIEKEEKRAIDSKYLEERLSNDIISSGFFAHIRRATIGEINIKNNHPFVEKDCLNNQWILMHNGTIFDSDELGKYLSKQNGTTDSERILLHIVDKINEAIKKHNRPLLGEEKFEIVEKIVLKLSKGNKLNLIVFDGQYYYIHENQEGTLFVKEKEGASIFSTTPLDEEQWTEVPLNQLLVYQKGQLVYQGTVHQNTYIYDEAQYKYLFMAYANM